MKARAEQKKIDELYFKGLEAEANQDYTTAFNLFKQGAVLGDSSAQHALACAYDSGKGVAQDKVVALSWFKKAWRTEQQSVYCNAIALTYIELGQRRRGIYWWRKGVALEDGTCALVFAKYLLKEQPRTWRNQVIGLLQMTVALLPPIGISEDEQEEARKLLNEVEGNSLQ